MPPAGIFGAQCVAALGVINAPPAIADVGFDSVSASSFLRPHPATEG
jgi:hypothetical protein